MISDAPESWAVLTCVKQVSSVGETSREAFPQDIMKRAIVSLLFKTRQYLQYKFGPLLIKADLLKTITSPHLYILMSAKPNGFLFFSPFIQPVSTSICLN